MPESIVFTAFAFGLLSAASLPAGALIGVRWRPEDRVMAFLLAFGGGALLAALTIDLVASALQKGHFGALACGALLGGALFKILDWHLNRRGGFLRKPSTAINYWRGKARQRLEKALSELRRLDLSRQISSEDMEKLLSIFLVREYPAGSYLYRKHDPADQLYVIEEGEVELLDPVRSDPVFERLDQHDAFGRLSFVTGAPRATEAVAATKLRVLVLPRDPFMAILESAPTLKDTVEDWIAGPEVARYLAERHGMEQAEIEAWSKRAVTDLRESDRFEPPLRLDELREDPVHLLSNADSLGFLDGLPEAELARIAERLIFLSVPRGETFFALGENADRLYILESGEVALFGPKDRTHRPATARRGRVFGILSFLTEGAHTVTAMATEDSDAYVLRRADFDELLDSSESLRECLLGYLEQQRLTDYLTDMQRIAGRKAAHWVNRAVTSVRRGQAFPALTDMAPADAAHAGAALAIFLGIMLDGIPESLVIGANALHDGTVSFSLIGGVFLSNFPEALSSSAGMKEQGYPVSRIVSMWSALMLMTGAGAAIGSLALAGAPHALFALIQGVAAGAMLTVIAETMLPEAFLKGGGVVGISTLMGFLAAIFLNTLD